MKRIVAFALLLLLCLSFASCARLGRGGGLSAYEVAVENGYKGDEQRFPDQGHHKLALPGHRQIQGRHPRLQPRR